MFDNFRYPLGVKKSTIPAGEKGRWRIEKIKLTQDKIGLRNLRRLRDGTPEMCVGPGNYTKLLVYNDTHWHVMMSDTRMEALTNQPGIARSTGRVLVNGLGIGFFLENILEKSDVRFVRVVEIDRNLIRLVAPHFKEAIVKKRLQIICANALQRRAEKDEFYDFIWHDIWQEIGGDDYFNQKAILKRRWGRRCKDQLAWAEYEAERERRRWG